MNNYINKSHFWKWLTRSPYFIWNDFGSIFSPENSGNNSFNLLLNTPDYEEQDNSEFNWLNLIEQELLWSDFDPTTKNNYEIKDVKTYNLIENAMDKFLLSKFDSVYFIRTKKIDDAIVETKKVIKENKYHAIANPVFEHKKAISHPKVYDCINHKLYTQLLSASTRQKDWINMYWDYHIAKKTVKIKELFLIIFSTEPVRKGEIGFTITPRANIQKQTPSLVYPVNNLEEFSRFDPEIKKAKGKLKAGLSYGNKLEIIQRFENHDEFFTFANFFVERKPMSKTVFNYRQEKLETVFVDNVLWSMLERWEIDKVIDEIWSSKKILTYDLSLIEEMKYQNQWGHYSDYFNDLLLHHNHEWASVSGHLIGKNRLRNAIINENPITESGTLGLIKGRQNKILKSEIDHIIKDLKHPNKRIIWYDFEGFSLPTATLDFFPPFQQTIFQVSVIETNNEKIVSTVNKVFDPQTLNGQNFAEIINTIYNLQADVFVVYNKSYENTRLKEMADWLVFTNHPFAHQETEKVQWIINHTVDLSDLFVVRSNNKVPPIFLWELKGKYSIKAIEKYIHHHKLQLPVNIVPYQNLEVQNGLMAMELAIQRALGIIGDKKWFEKSKELKTYCENDVRAMIMVYHFASSFVNKQG